MSLRSQFATSNGDSPSFFDNLLINTAGPSPWDAAKGGRCAIKERVETSRLVNLLHDGGRKEWVRGAFGDLAGK